MQGGGRGYGNSSLCSHSILTLLWKGTFCFKNWSWRPAWCSPIHCCSYSSLCPSPGSVRARQDCSSALSKGKHIADNTSAVTEHSKLFWLTTIFVSPLSIYKCSKRNCVTFLKMKKKLKYGITETWRIQTKWDSSYNCAEKAALKITMIIPESDPVLGWLF